MNWFEDEMMEFKDYRIMKFIGIFGTILWAAFVYLFVHILLGKFYLVDNVFYVRLSFLLPSIVLAVYSRVIAYILHRYDVNEHSDWENTLYTGLVFTSRRMANYMVLFGCILGLSAKFIARWI